MVWNAKQPRRSKQLFQGWEVRRRKFHTKVVALQKIGSVEQAARQTGDVDTGKVVGLAVEVATNAQKLWVKAGCYDSVCEEVWDGVRCNNAAAPPVFWDALPTEH